MNEQAVSETQREQPLFCAPIPLAIVGAGVIARDAHRPALELSPDFDLVACIDPSGGIEGLPCYASLQALLAAGPPVGAVAICTPPAVRKGLAIDALEAGLHVLLEKPPALAAADVEGLRKLAVQSKRTLFTAWHSCEAPGIVPARAWLAGKVVQSVQVRWREHVDQFHPGQAWIREADGFGVFDPAINAFSILTSLFRAVDISRVRAFCAPGWAAPTRAALDLVIDGREIGHAELDFMASGDPEWVIEIETAEGEIVLSEGGGRLSIVGTAVNLGPSREYPALYDAFAGAIAEARQAVDVVPLALAETALSLARASTPDRAAVR